MGLSTWAGRYVSLLFWGLMGVWVGGPPTYFLLWHALW